MKKTLLSTLAFVFAAASLSLVSMPAEAKHHKAKQVKHVKHMHKAKKAGAVAQ